LTLWLLNHLSTAALALLVVGGTTTLAVVAATVIIPRVAPNLPHSGFEDLTGILRADVFAVLYSIVLGLVIADLSGNLATASLTVSEEAAALNGVMLAANSVSANPTPAYPNGPRRAMRDAVGEYVNAVVQDEFPKMRTGDSSDRASAALEGLHGTIRSYEPKSPSEEAFYNEAVKSLGDVTSLRRERLEQSQGETSGLLRLLLIVGGVAFVILAYPASTPSAIARALIVGAITAFVSFAYLLTMTLDYPFAGEESVGTGPYKTGALAVIFGAESQPRPLEAETFERLTPKDLVGVWNSGSGFGTMVFREVGNEIIGAYRFDEGTIVGTISPDGILKAWWCEEVTRRPPRAAGDVEWRLLRTDNGQKTLDGRYRRGSEEPFRGGWDLTKLEDTPEPPDLAARFATSAAFCRHP